MSHNHCQIWVHVVWTTKDRENLFTTDFLYHKIKPLLRKIALENDIQIGVVNGYKNHIHCLIRLKSTQSLSGNIQKLKGVSSRVINENKWFDFEFSWQIGYHALSVSPNRIQSVNNYIKKSVEKISNMSLDEELRDF
ncbi:IS200/IS605 family transposase [Flammeovirga sp. OC4]|uniref:IS200/IS605 family transposase n=1 Tax=Flammeovirga sp. OC4 TaxID=1382345 RepID=UPI0005C781AB|nr:IS200/IS605 family transposase [Flammeovirga sp. OC4]